MYTKTTLLSLLGLLGLSSAAPTPVALVPRCGTTVYPTFLQQLVESSPDTIQADTLSTGGAFHVSQSSTPGNRIYQVVGFENIPSGYGCSLGITLPSPAPVTVTGTPTLNITTLDTGNSAGITYPNSWDWDTVVGQSDVVDQGLFGTVTVGSGTSGTINSEGCPVGGGNLAFLFSIASWIEGDASVDFTEYWNGMNGQGLVGVYLTMNC